MIITLNPTLTHIEDIPFPAVTICNMNRVKKSVINKLQNDSDEYKSAHRLCIKTWDDDVQVSTTNTWSEFKSTLLKVWIKIKKFQFLKSKKFKFRN